MTTEQLELAESEIAAELLQMATAEQSIHKPILDGVVDASLYLAASPRILWILKEPWEEFGEGESAGGWSVTKDIIGKGIDKDTGTHAIMAYVTYAVFNGYIGEQEVPYVTANPEVANSLKHIAYINVSKMPGGKTSDGAFIAQQYQKNQRILHKQIETLAPDVIVAGNTMHLFLKDFALQAEMFTRNGSASFCKTGGRLYIDAYHPNQRSFTRQNYVDSIVSIIRSELTPKPQSPA